MPRYALKIEYNGDGFCGWQRQNDQRTVQGEVEAALRVIDPSVEGIIAAGRTDTGVHALGQVAHVDLAKDWKPEKIMGAVNYHLRHVRVAVIAVAPVADDWSARFSAGERQYLFRLVCRRGPLSHDAGLAWRIGHGLDVPAMRDGAAHLIGLHDFTTFRSTHCQAASPVKTIDEITITEHDYPNGAEVRFFLRARSFLHNQVRSIVGSLERVGSSGWEPDRMATALAAKQRSACGPVCPPDGLYLSHVVYEDDPF